jgi:hypothetical protein
MFAGSACVVVPDLLEPRRRQIGRNSRSHVHGNVQWWWWGGTTTATTTTTHVVVPTSEKLRAVESQRPRGARPVTTQETLRRCDTRIARSVVLVLERIVVSFITSSIHCSSSGRSLGYGRLLWFLVFFGNYSPSNNDFASVSGPSTSWCAGLNVGGVHDKLFGSIRLRVVAIVHGFNYGILAHLVVVVVVAWHSICSKRGCTKPVRAFEESTPW